MYMIKTINLKKFICLLSALVIGTLLLTSCTSSTTESEDEEYEMEQFEWSTYDNGQQIPIAKSDIGDVQNDNDVSFSVYIANMTFEDFKEYVTECIDRGFTEEAVAQEHHYHAFNDYGYELTVKYIDDDIMYIEIVEPLFDVQVKVLHANKKSARKYDIVVYVDDFEEATIEKGDMVANTDLTLKKGKHVLSIANAEDEDICGYLEFDVAEDTFLEYEISCTDIDIEIATASEKTDVKSSSKSSDVEKEKTKETTKPTTDSSQSNTSQSNIENNSNITNCEVCNLPGTHTITGFSGEKEYYCNNHYNEMVLILISFYE